LAVPVLAGSGAYAISEMMKWKEGLDFKFSRARGFYSIIIISILFGLGLNFFDINPIKALYYSAFINGIIAVPLLIAIMVVGDDKRIMKSETHPFWVRIFGWFGVVAMTIAVILMGVLYINILLGSLVLVAVFILSGCSGATGTSQGVKPEKVEKPADQNAESQDTQKQQKIFRIGDTIKLGDYVIIVNKIEDPFKSSNQFMQPKAGNRLVAVDVSYLNDTTDKSLSYNPFDWKLFDSQGYNFQTGFSENKEPSLNSGTLNSGGKVRGWVTFEIPNDSKEFKIQFVPSLFDNDSAEIQLY
jgi:hypothetical protein